MKHNHLSNKNTFSMFVGSAMFAVLVSVFGCGRDTDVPAPMRDGLRSQVLFELFDALEAGDAKLALNNLERLRELDGDDRFIETTEQFERRRILIRTVNEHLKNHDFAGAIGYLEGSMKRQGVDNFADALLSKIRVLLEIAAFREGFPFSSAADAGQRLDALTLKLKMLGEGDLVESWVEVQRGRIEEQRRLELERRLDPLVRRVDLALAQGQRDEAAAAIAEMRKAQPDYHLLKMIDALGIYKYEKLRSTVMGMREEPLFNRDLEIALVFNWARMQRYPQFLDAVYEYLRSSQAVGVCGHRVRSLLLLRAGDVVGALTQASRLADKGGTLDLNLWRTLNENTVLKQDIDESGGILQKLSEVDWFLPWPQATEK